MNVARLSQLLLGCLPILLLIGLWQAIVSFGNAPPSLLPPPGSVFLRFFQQLATPEFLSQIGATLFRLFAGFFIAVVLGVSLDTVEGHKAWCSKDTFSFKLLADPDHKVVDLYGVPVAARGDMKFAARQTFLISPEGKVVKYWPKVDVQTHSDEVLAEIAANKK